MENRGEEKTPTHLEKALRWLRTVRPEDLLKWATVLTLITLMVTVAAYVVAQAWQAS